MGQQKCKNMIHMDTVLLELPPSLELPVFHSHNCQGEF